jgi:hypothetical protein
MDLTTKDVDNKKVSVRVRTSPFIKIFYNIRNKVPSDHLKNKSSLLWCLCYSMGCHR